MIEDTLIFLSNLYYSKSLITIYTLATLGNSVNFIKGNNKVH